MLLSWLVSWLRRHVRSSSADHGGSKHAAARENLLGLVQLKSATALRSDLKLISTDKQEFTAISPKILAAAEKAAWPDVEFEKLKAYIEFFSGNPAQAFQRVLVGRLAETDFELLMTACVQCYLADRFEEGYSLLMQFEQRQMEAWQQSEFLAFAGYLAFASGRDISEACRHFDLALDLGHLSALLAVNAYPIYFEAGLHDQANRVRSIIQQHHSADPEAVFAVACVELARDYYGEGFRLAETRYQMPEAGTSINASLFNKVRWKGEEIREKTLLVHAEQGLGDIIQMARYFPFLQRMGADILLDCRSEAISLLAHNFPSIDIVAGDPKTPIAMPFDVWTGAMSLPAIFDTTAETVPGKSGYLTVPSEQIMYWQKRVTDFAGQGVKRVGLAWSGNPRHRADKRRSISFEKIAGYLRENCNIRFFSLQTAVPSVRPSNLVDASEEMLTLADTAAIIWHMDLIITVDTSVVHLAGALGKPTLLLLPKRYEWRWSLDGESNNWYDSVRVIRQKSQGDWENLLDEVFKRHVPEFFASLEEAQCQLS